MQDSKTNDAMVFIELTDSGELLNVGLELLTPGRMVAEKQGGKLIAVVIGAATEEAAKAVAKRDVDEVLVVEGPEFAPYSTDAFADALCAVAEEHGPASLLVGATNNGRDVAPRVSSRLRTGLTADCTSIGFDDETGNVAWTRPAFGGNLMAVIMCPDNRPQIGTVRPGVFKQGEDTGTDTPITRVDFHEPPERIRTRIISIIEDKDREQVDLENAEIIVAGGAGLGNAKGFDELKKLADALGAPLAASRVAVDNGWISHAHQVGQTGKTVSPKLYIACGISGAIQHTAGAEGSQILVAINKDPAAAIFDVADFGIVGDLYEIIPALTKEVEALHASTE